MGQYLQQLLFWTTVLTLTPNESDGCKSMVFTSELGFNDQALTNFTFKTVTAANEPQCRAQCYIDDSCLSYNFISTEKICELCESDHLMHPESLKPRVGAIYRAANNTCSCAKDTICRYNFVTSTHRCEARSKEVPSFSTSNLSSSTAVSPKSSATSGSAPMSASANATVSSSRTTSETTASTDAQTTGSNVLTTTGSTASTTTGSTAAQTTGSIVLTTTGRTAATTTGSTDAQTTGSIVLTTTGRTAATTTGSINAQNTGSIVLTTTGSTAATTTGSTDAQTTGSSSATSPGSTVATPTSSATVSATSTSSIATSTTVRTGTSSSTQNSPTSQASTSTDTATLASTTPTPTLSGVTSPSSQSSTSPDVSPTIVGSAPTSSVVMTNCVIRFPKAHNDSLIDYYPRAAQDLTQFSILFWIRVDDSYKEGPLSVLYYMLPGAKNFLLAIENIKGDNLQITLPNNIVDIDGNLKRDGTTWHHYAITFYENKLVLYLYGKRRSDKGLNEPQFVLPKEGFFRIGSSPASSCPDYCMVADISGLNIYTHSLDETTIRNIYESGCFSSKGSLVAWNDVYNNGSRKGLVMNQCGVTCP